MGQVVIADVFDSAALPLLLELEAAGFELRPGGDDAIEIRPAGRLAPELRAELLRYKRDVLTLLRVVDEGVQARREVFLRQLVEAPAGTVPPFLFRASLPYVPGRCFACFDPLDAPRFGRCWRCALAWRLAVGASVSPELGRSHDQARLCS